MDYGSGKEFNCNMGILLSIGLWQLLPSIRIFVIFSQEINTQYLVT